MSRRLRNRVAEVEAALGSISVARELARPAFGLFQRTGVLPDDPHVAEAVIERARLGYDPFPNRGDPVLDRQYAIRCAVNAPPRADDPLMDALYDEAVWAPGPLRWAARETLQQIATLGLDVTKPLFAGRDVRLPETLSVGLHMCGALALLHEAPYRERSHALFERCTALSKRIDEWSEDWRNDLHAAWTHFEATGNLPSDPVAEEAVLVLVDLAQLVEEATSAEEPPATMP